MSMWWHIGTLIAFGFVLSASADLVVRAGTAVAKRLGLTDFTIGFFLLGILTSTPEISVAVQSSFAHVPQLSTGNLLGGSILLLSFVMGLLAVALGRLALDHQLKLQDLVSTCAVIAAPVLVLWDGALTRGEGMFLVGTYGVHALLLTHDGRKKYHSTHPWHRHTHRHPGLIIGMFVLGVIGLTVSSWVIVGQASVIMQSFPIGPVVFGLFILSLGTNLPELALAVRAIGHKGKDLALGDFLGSAAANTLILGFLGIFFPYGATEPHRVTAALAILATVTIFFLWSFTTGRSLSRREGMGLLLFYLLFVGYEVFM